MKGEKADYTISLEKAFMFPVTKRVRKALNEIRNFCSKHARAKETAISNEVNEFIHKNSKNIPRRIKAVLLKENERVVVFLQGGKELPLYIKKRMDEKKKKDAKKEKQGKKGEAKEQGAEEKKEGEKEAKKDAAAEEAEKKKLLEEKRQKEEAAKALEHKR